MIPRQRRGPAGLVALALVVATLVATTSPAGSAGGGLDTSFATTGAAQLDFDGGTDAVSDLALQTDGKVIVVGRTGSGFGLARYTTAGVLDTTFSGDGWVASGLFMTDARGVALQTDGRIVVVGRSASVNGALVVARYTTAGVLDTTFDTDGIATTVAMTGGGSGGQDVAVQSDGRVVALALDNGVLSVFRFTAVGALDPTWSGDGRADTGAVSTLINRIALQTDGKVVLTSGSSGSAGGVLRFNTDGTPDASFDGDGAATTTDHVANGLAIQTDGKVVYAGDQGSAGSNVLVARRNADGTLDATFGTSGVTTFAVPGLTQSTAWGVALQSDGKVVVTGRIDDSVATSVVFVARLTAAGVLDATFATNGIATFSSVASRATSGAHAIAIDSTGRFVVGGALMNASGIASDTDFAVLRVLITDAPATTTTSTTTTTTLPGQTAAGGTALSDPSGTTPSLGNKIVVQVRTPVAGRITFVKETGTPVVGNRTLSGVTITAPTATAAAPLQIDFSFDASSLPDSYPVGGVAVLRNDVVVPDCTSTTVAAPDPCAYARSRTGDTVAIGVLSSSASTWKLVQPIVQRIAGSSRVESAVAVSRSVFGDGEAEAVVVVRADGFADALAATPLAVAKEAPLLLSQTGALDDATLVEITRVLPTGGTVYLLGGTGALSDAVSDRIVSWGYEVVRFAGADRYATAVEVAEEGLGAPSVVIETTGLGFADALAAGAAAAELGGAVLLTAASEQAPATAAYLTRRRPTRYALGGPAAAADPLATAVVGADRYETAVLAAIRFFPGLDVVGLASGASFPDALAGGTHAGLAGGPLLLVPPSGTLPVSLTILFRNHTAAPPAAFLYGGTGAVSDEIVALLQAALGP